MEQDGTVFGEDELDVYAALPFCVADAMCNCLVIGLFDGWLGGDQRGKTCRKALVNTPTTSSLLLPTSGVRPLAQRVFATCEKRTTFPRLRSPIAADGLSEEASPPTTSSFLGLAFLADLAAFSAQ